MMYGAGAGATEQILDKAAGKEVLDKKKREKKQQKGADKRPPPKEELKGEEAEAIIEKAKVRAA